MNWFSEHWLQLAFILVCQHASLWVGIQFGLFARVVVSGNVLDRFGVARRGVNH